MQEKTKSKLNKPLTFWQRLAIAKKHRLKVESLGISFLKELCNPNSKLNLTKNNKVIGYLHYEAGLPLIQISNDMGIAERPMKQLNQDLLDALGVRQKFEDKVNASGQNPDIPVDDSHK